MLIMGAPVQAQRDDQSQAESVTIVRGDITADDVNVIAREMRCPLCSGVRLDACETKAAIR